MPTKRLILAASAALALTASAPAMATVAESYNDFSGAELISGAEAPPTFYELAGADREAGEPDIPGPGSTVWFKWTPASSGATFADVCGEDDSLHHVRVYRAAAGFPAALGTLQPARGDDTEWLPAGSSCRLHWRASAGQTYFIQIDGGGDAYEGWLVVDQDPQAPDAPVVDASWPGITGPDHTATFTGEGGAAFICRLDQGGWEPCTSPAPLAGLSPGAHEFGVRALDDHGNVSPAATRIWAVESPAAANDAIVQPAAPQGQTAAAAPVGLTVARAKRARRHKRLKITATRLRHHAKPRKRG